MTDTSAVPPASETPPPPSVRQRKDMSLEHKIALIVCVAIATIIPSYLIWGLIEEREARQSTVQQEFTKNWGPQQYVYSPILVVPYQPAPLNTRYYLKIAPSRLNLNATLMPQERRRGLFHATVYDAKIEMQGTFVVPNETRLKDFDKDQRFLWNEAFIAFGSKEGLAGFQSDDSIAINGVETPWLPCLEGVRQAVDCRDASLVVAKIQAGSDVPLAGEVSFKSVINLRGTTSFNLLHGGKELNATIRSPWRSPSFGGDLLPLSSNVTSRGFDASWQSLEFGSPRVASTGFVFDRDMWKGAAIGVELREATPVYRMINRVAKYGLLFVALSFAVYFFFETISGFKIHIVQYGMLGLSLTLFALLLLSLAELIGYTPAYIASAGLVLAQSSLYTASVTKRARPALVFAGVLAALFGFFYVVLSLETYSLLVGALALFLVLSVLMVLTQRVSWTARPAPAGAGA
jgi:inner membrane protein